MHVKVKMNFLSLFIGNGMKLFVLDLISVRKKIHFRRNAQRRSIKDQEEVGLKNINLMSASALHPKEREK